MTKALNWAENKILFVSPYATEPKKMALPKKIFHVFFFFFLLFIKIYTFSLEYFSLLHVLHYFSIQFCCKILN